MNAPSAKDIISQSWAPLKIEVEEHSPGAVVVQLDGVLALGGSSSMLSEKIGELAKRQDLKKLVLDLGGVRYLDSSGLAVLVTGSTVLKNHGIELSLAHLTTKLNDLLRVTKLYTVFNVYDSVQQALAMTKYKVGDTVRVIKTRQTAKIIGKGSMALARPDNTTWTILPDSGPPSVTVLPEEIEPL